MGMRKAAGLIDARVKSLKKSVRDFLKLFKISEIFSEFFCDFNDF